MFHVSWQYMAFVITSTRVHRAKTVLYRSPYCFHITHDTSEIQYIILKKEIDFKSAL